MPQNSRGDRRGGPRLIGAVIAMVIGAVLLFVILPIGGLVVLGLGVYIGVLARRTRALGVASPSTHGTLAQDGEPLVDESPTPPAVRKFRSI